MTFSTDLGWLNIQELDPRVDQLVAVALTAMACGEGHAVTPDMLYSDMKPFLRALVGSGRGSIGAVRHAPPREHEIRFLEVVLQPWTGLESSSEYLRTQWLYDVACNYILDKLATVHAGLHGYAA